MEIQRVILVMIPNNLEFQLERLACVLKDIKMISLQQITQYANTNQIAQSNYFIIFFSFFYVKQIKFFFPRYLLQYFYPNKQVLLNDGLKFIVIKSAKLPRPSHQPTHFQYPCSIFSPQIPLFLPTPPLLVFPLVYSQH